MAEEAETEDQFELRLKFKKYIKSISNQQTLKSTISFCTKNERNSSIIFECIMENLKEDYKNRRAVLSFLENLIEVPQCSEYVGLIRMNLHQIFDILLPKDKTLETIWYRPSAKGLQSLLECLPEITPSLRNDYQARINASLGLSETEQKYLKKKQRVLEQIEKDRESHKALREACWNRMENESIEHEFLSFYHQSKPVTSDTITRSFDNNSYFEKLNGICRQRHGSSSSIIVIHLEEVFFDIRRYKSDRNSKVRFCAEDLYGCIKSIAKSCFFYSDLKYFDQPHVQYYNDDDDGKNLSDYDFNKDDLSRYSKGEINDPEPRFYKERAYRYRLSSFRYSSSLELRQLIPHSTEKNCGRLLKELDYLLNHHISRSLTILEKLTKKSQNTFCFVTDEHLSLALAGNVLLRIEKEIPPISLYSTTKYDLGWILSQIKLKYNNSNSILVLGNTTRTERETEKIGGEYIYIGRSSDLENFANGIIKMN